MPQPSYPVMDAPRSDADNELGRIVLQGLGAVEPHLPEIDWWVTMPLRLVYDQGGDVHLELGPYGLGQEDIETLRAAIYAYDNAIERGKR